jgi:GNAT superfamily N-acetyltransferase
MTDAAETAVAPLCVSVYPVTPGNWRRLRSIRLRALADSPTAFLGECAVEATRTDEQWAAACREAHWFLAERVGTPIGLGCVAEYPKESPRLHLEAMWVEPETRRTGVGHALLRYAEAYAVQHGETELGLWVVRGNDAAEGIYRAAGYVPTGREGPLSNGRHEREYSRRLQ